MAPIYYIVVSSATIMVLTAALASLILITSYLYKLASKSAKAVSGPTVTTYIWLIIT